MNDSEGQRIEQWHVFGGSKIVGEVYNRPGHRDGGTIVTSTVVEIRWMGTGNWMQMYPVAFTASGSAYRLGQPASDFGMERAEAFIQSKLPGATEPGDWCPAAPDYDPNATVVRGPVESRLPDYEQLALRDPLPRVKRI